MKSLSHLLFIVINEYYYSAVESKKLQEHLTTEKNKTNDNITQDKNSSQSVAGSVLVDLVVI